MAKILDTSNAVSELKDLIKGKSKSLTLISPYLKLHDSFQELLKYRDEKMLQTTIIVRTENLNKEMEDFLQSLDSVTLKYNEHLHAKCYADDSKIIITSLNLYDFSMINNKELGILLHRSDKGLFDKALEEIDFIERSSTMFKEGKISGFCIRDGVEIPFNIKKPMCSRAYSEWKKFNNDDYEEKYCHFTGEESKGRTSFKLPILFENWNKAKEKWKF